MQYTIDDIKNRYNNNEKLSYLFFWGHRPNPDGSISNGCFSQWWQPCNFVVDGITYNCAEQYMMAEKARLFPDNEKLLNEFILKETNPSKHKKYGRQVKNYDDAKWNSVRKDVVIKGNIAKFSQNEKLRDYLLATGDKILVEASPYDNIWGIKMNANTPGIENPYNWKGTNNLGFALMEVRDFLRNNIQ